MKTWASIIFAAVLIIGSVGCSSSANPNSVGPEKTEVVNPIDYGEGVYYFPAAGATFGNSLAIFRKYHPELTVVAITGMDVVGGITGYWVVTEGEPKLTNWP